MKLTAIDLFSGGGGLSEGLKQAGFSVIGAVENDLNTVDTYRANHKSTYLFDYDIKHLSVDEVISKCKIERGELDLLAGCPPCQGFSTLTRNYDSEDKRNSLIKEVARLIDGLLPKTIMIENVPGLKSRGASFLDEFLQVLERNEYQYCYDVLQVADYGVPQTRRRFVLLASRVGTVSIPEPTHSMKGEKKKWNTVKDAICGLDEPITLSESNKKNGAKAYNWNIIRDLSAINLERLKHIPSGGNRFYIPEYLRPNCHKGSNTGYSNVYGRMDWNSPSPTITGGCTTLSKGRFGHPEKQRTISVREAAKLQTFPDSYVFDSDFIDHVCQIIGNALPVEFAKKMSQSCIIPLINQSSSTESQ